MYCGNCGNQIDEQQRFCPYCGATVKNKEQFGYAYGSSGYQPYNAEVKNYNLISAYLAMFKKYAQFNGRSRRSEYWFATLGNYILMMVVYAILYIPMIVDIVNHGEPTTATIAIAGIVGLLIMIYAFAILIPSLALSVRRLHDTGRSGWCLLLSLIPFVGGVIVFVFMVLDSQQGANRYGTNPKGL